MAEEPALPPPRYAPEVVAGTILRCAQHPVPEAYVGGAARMMTLFDLLAPRLHDLYARRVLAAQEKSARANDRRDSLYAPGRDVRRGTSEGIVLRSSLYTRAALSDFARAIPLLALGGAVALGLGAVTAGAQD